MHLRSLSFLWVFSVAMAAEPEFPLTPDSQPQASVPKGELIKGSYTARDGSVFPGTVREYQIYLPAGLDKSKPAAFMVFQDGVIYQAPVVFDNLIAKKDIPPLVGLFIKPGVVPAANENALPRFNRSYEYDSITPTYSDFLIDEFLPAIESKHSLKLSTDPNHAAISGNSSGGICAFMVAWHRPDRFRRVFTGVGTYVGIHGADQLPVLVRKFEPKPLRIFLQSGTGDNNLYCGDWWMANQMMERSLTWAGYEVNHAWGEGGHNQKHASQIFPDVLRWLWRDWPTTMEIQANPKGESKWKGYEVLGAGEWEKVYEVPKAPQERLLTDAAPHESYLELCSAVDGKVYASSMENNPPQLLCLGSEVTKRKLPESLTSICSINGNAWLYQVSPEGKTTLKPSNTLPSSLFAANARYWDVLVTYHGLVIASAEKTLFTFDLKEGEPKEWGYIRSPGLKWPSDAHSMCLSPDQTQLYMTADGLPYVWMLKVDEIKKEGEDKLSHGEPFCKLDGDIEATGLCVDTNGWLYVATSLGIQVCDQAGRVNFILPTPKQPLDVCFGGKDLSELFIACGDTIYKRPTKAKGVVSGQQAPIKPLAPKL